MSATFKDVPAVYVHHLLNILAELGISSDKVLESSQLTLKELQDPTTMITFDEQLEIFISSVKHSPVPDLGVRLGRTYILNDIGVLGYAILTSANYEQALRLGCRYMRLTGAGYELKFSMDEAFYYIRVCNCPNLGVAHQLVMEELVFSILSSSSALMDGDIRYHHIAFDFPENDCKEIYAELLACPVYFDYPQTEIVISVKYGELPLKFWNPQTAAACEQQCEKMLNNLRKGDSFSHQVKKLLMQLPCDQRRAEIVAERKNISTRHLRRKLTDENTSFREILNEFRQELAKEYLTHTELPLEEITQLLGFTETTNFRRSFIKWTGLSPKQFRENLVRPAET